jgi:hypothetical protein
MMPDLDLPKLREIAESANTGDAESYWEDFLQAFDPATVLALINELDQLRAGWSPTDEMAVLRGELTVLAAKNKSLLDEIDRLKDVIGRRDQLVAQYIINDIAAQAETATLRSRIEELEKA